MNATPQASAIGQAREWLDALAATLAAQQLNTLPALFAADCFWRDFLAFTWNIKTVEGPAGVEDMLSAVLADVQPRHFRIEESVGRAFAESAVRQVASYAR